ncbi:hypothetical protein [Treponema sp. R6D11]
MSGKFFPWSGKRPIASVLRGDSCFFAADINENSVKLFGVSILRSRNLRSRNLRSR